MKLYQKQWLNELNQHIEQNLQHTNFSTQELAYLMNISLSSLHRKLGELLQCTPAEYIKSKRFELAKRLIAQGISPQLITRKIGFNNTKELSHLFLQQQEF